MTVEYTLSMDELKEKYPMGLIQRFDDGLYVVNGYEEPMSSNNMASYPKVVYKKIINKMEGVEMTKTVDCGLELNELKEKYPIGLVKNIDNKQYMVIGYDIDLSGCGKKPGVIYKEFLADREEVKTTVERHPAERVNGKWVSIPDGLAEFTAETASKLCSKYPDIDILDLQMMFMPSFNFEMSRLLAISTVNK